MPDFGVDDIETTMGRSLWTFIREHSAHRVWSKAADYIYLIEQEAKIKAKQDIISWIETGLEGMYPPVDDEEYKIINIVESTIEHIKNMDK